MANKVDNKIFRLTLKESRSKEYANVSDIDIDPEYSKRFSEDAIRRAKQLKKKHGDKYTDAFYLDYGKSLVLQDLIAGNIECHKTRVKYCDIKDVNWAEYSYEEILGMEALGYKIPEEIIQWAHAQQQSDVTDYVIVSENGTEEDSNTSPVNTVEDEFKNLQNDARKNVAKAEAAQHKVEEKVQTFDLISDKAEDIKKQNEKSYKDKLKEVTDLTSEWKRLNDKKASGKLNNTEAKRYDELSKMLNGKTGSKVNDFQANDLELDMFLDALDGLNEDIEANLIIARNTVKSGVDLAKYEKQYNDSQLPTATATGKFDGNGKQTDTLYDVKGTNIADVAVEKGDELKIYNEDLSLELNGGETAKVADFAKDYTNGVNSLELPKEEVKEEDKKSDSDNEVNQKEKAQKEYEVDGGFGIVKAAMATNVNASSTKDVKAKKSDVNANNKKLQKELKKVNKDAQLLSKEVTSSEQVLVQNTQKEEDLMANLEVANAQAPSKENESKKDIALTDLQATQDENKVLKGDVKKALTKSEASTSKGEKLSKVLNEQSMELAPRTKNASQVSDKTQGVGVGTMSQGVLTTGIGVGLYSTGMSLIASPFTYPQGMSLMIAGKALQTLGKKEVTYGLVATTSSIKGSKASDDAKDANKAAIETLKIAKKTYKDNKSEFKEANVLTDDKDQAQVVDSTQTEAPVAAVQTSEQPQSRVQEQASEQVLAQQQTTQPEAEVNAQTQAQTQAQAQEPQVQDEHAVQEDSKTQNPEAEKEVQAQNPAISTVEDSEEPAQAQKTSAPEKSAETEDAQTKENEVANEKAQNSEQSLSIGFSASNAIKATILSTKTTDKIVQEQSSILKMNSQVAKNTKQSETIQKQIQKETVNAEQEHEKNLVQSQNITNQVEAAQNVMATSENPDEVSSNQDKVASLISDFDVNSNAENQVSAQANKKLSANIKNLSKFGAINNTLNKDLAVFNKSIKSHNDIANKTIGIGLGTTAFGVLNINQGSTLIATSIPLIANPFTASAGYAQQLWGKMVLAKGVASVAAGTTATTVGTVASITNKDAKDSEATSKVTQKLAKVKDKDSKKAVQELNNVKGAELEEPEVKTVQNQSQQDEEETLTEDIATISASASSNSNLNDVQTTDKDDRKLSRFNTESIIESKKKLKKVQAVMAYTRNKK